MTFDSKMTVEKHLRSVSRAASHRLGILRKSWRVFMVDYFLGDTFVFFPAHFGVLFCSMVLDSDTHFKLLVPIVSGASFYLGVCLS